MGGSKAPLACVWHEEWFYAAGSVPQNGVKALGFHVIKLEEIYNTDSCNFPCIQSLYERIFNATIQLATQIICMKCALHHD